MKVPNKVRNERLAWAFSLRRAPQSGHVEHVSRKVVNLVLKQVSLEGTEKLFGLREGQPKMLDMAVVLVKGHHIGDGLFLTLIAAHDELQFDTHTGASPGSSGR